MCDNNLKCAQIAICDRVNTIDLYNSNCNILNSYTSIKEGIIKYINNVSETFGNLHAGLAYDERGKMNIMIESLIACIHQACGIVDDKLKFSFKILKE